jgi:hypothetical protein
VANGATGSNCEAQSKVRESEPALVPCKICKNLYLKEDHTPLYNEAAIITLNV